MFWINAINPTNRLDWGILVMRVTVGILMMFHGIPKLLAGSETRTQLGGAMSYLGIDAGHAFWWFMGAFAESFGGLFLILGAWTMPFAFLLAFTMLVASIMHRNTTQASWVQAFMDASHSFKLFWVFVALIITWPWKYSIDEKQRVCMIYNISQGYKDDHKKIL